VTTPTTTTGSWRPVGDLPFAANTFGRTGSAVPLADGRVLFAGGGDPQDNNLATAAVYTPAAGTWAVTGSMAASRRVHSLTSLGGGRVLAVGGLTGTLQFPLPATRTAELYDPAAGTWTATGSLGLARHDHSASLLPDGRVLVAGGTFVRSASSNASTETCEIYDPSTGVWSAAAPMSDARSGHCAVTLADGRVLVIGGWRYTTLDAGVGTAYCELFDPATGTWSPTGSMSTPRHSHQAVLLPDGTVLAIGGGVRQLGGESVVDPHSVSTVERFDPSSRQWSPAAGLPWPRSEHLATVLDNGHVLVAGGCDQALSDTGYHSVLLYDPVGDVWTAGAPMATPRRDFSMARLPDGGVLVVAGITAAGSAIADYGTDRITPASEVFAP
jgi:hypothetical protein